MPDGRPAANAVVGGSAWGEPNVAFRVAGIEDDHLAELVTEAWRVQAPRYLRRELDGVGRSLRARANTAGQPT